MHRVNLGTLLRTGDAVGACLAVPRLPWVPEALARGNTLRRPACGRSWPGSRRPGRFSVRLPDNIVRIWRLG